NSERAALPEVSVRYSTVTGSKRNGGVERRPGVLGASGVNAFLSRRNDGPSRRPDRPLRP
ncbi:MAG TPA: hypothetical protein VIS96_16800, partial [Terrimicrobiaceae bacterium]